MAGKWQKVGRVEEGRLRGEDGLKFGFYSVHGAPIVELLISTVCCDGPALEEAPLAA